MKSVRIMTGIIYFIALANAYGWEDKNTHPEISEYATMLYIAPYSDATDFLDSPFQSRFERQSWLQRLHRIQRLFEPCRLIINLIAA